MDEWTRKTMVEYDEGYKTRVAGLYVSNHAIYGLREGPHAPGGLGKLSETYRMLRIINNLHFSNFIDIGGGDGFFASTIRRLWRIPSFTVDFSFEANLRAKEIFGINGITTDIHSLPIKSNSFDLVFSWNVLEHLSDPNKVMSEMMRIARKYVIIVTPRARTKEEQAKYFKTKRYDHHLWFFTEEELRRIVGKSSFFVMTTSILNDKIMPIFEGGDIRSYSACSGKSYSHVTINAYNLLKNISEIRSISHLKLLIWLDDKLADFLPCFSRNFVALKQVCPVERTKSKINNKEILDFLLTRNKVSKHVLRNHSYRFNEHLLNFLVCPRCKEEFELQHSNLFCSKCNKAYLIKQSIPIII